MTEAVVDLDTPEATIVHGRLIRSKRFLHEIYREHYEFFRAELASVPEGALLELGSGGGFIKDIIPRTNTSDVVKLPGVDLVCSGLNLPYADGAVSAIMMINVLHHIQDVAEFFREARRCLAPGGKILMVEPANTMFSSFIYRNFHHEPFETKQVDWQLPKGGRMSMANDALPWIVLCRDRRKFELEFPEFRIKLLKNCMPVRYILSGGVSKKQMLPDVLYQPVKLMEQLLTPFNNLIGLFMRVSIERR